MNELRNYFVSLRSIQTQYFRDGQRNTGAFLRGILDILFDAARENRRLVYPLKRVVSAFFNVDDFDKLIETFIRTKSVLAPAEKVSLAGAVASIAMLEDKPVLASRLWSTVLVASRSDNELGLVGISDATYERYDRNAFHRVPARELSTFAIGSIYHKRRGNLLCVLDLCCGTGLAASYIHQQCQSLVGVDLELSGLLASGRNTQYTQLLEGDVQSVAPRLKDQRFDLVLMNGAAYFFDDLRWLMDIGSLLQSGGEICVNVFLCPDEHDVMATYAGTKRYCHSIPYLARIAEEAGMRLMEWVPSMLYSYPVYLVRIEKPSQETSDQV